MVGAFLVPGLNRTHLPQNLFQWTDEDYHLIGNAPYC